MNTISMHEDTALDYLLGWMSPGKRRRIDRRMETDPALARSIDELRACLQPLNALCDPVTPPPEVWNNIVASLANASKRSARISFAILATSVALGCAMLLFQIQPRALYQADLKIATIEVTDHNDLIVTEVALPSVPADQSLELWIIPAGGKPRSLGVLPQGKVYTAHSDLVADHATLAISREPLGGSPTGSPTGPVIVAGELHHL